MYQEEILHASHYSWNKSQKIKLTGICDEI
jgi:hypothetical protein